MMEEEEKPDPIVSFDYQFDEFDCVDGCGDDDDDYIDIEELLGRKDDPQQSNQEEYPSLQNLSHGDSSPSPVQLKTEFQEIEEEDLFRDSLSNDHDASDDMVKDYLKNNQEASDPMVSAMDGSNGYYENLEPKVQNGPRLHNPSVSFENWLQINQGPLHGMPNCGASFFTEGDGKPFLDNSNLSIQGTGSISQFSHGADQLESRDCLDTIGMEDGVQNFIPYNSVSLNAQENPDYTESDVYQGSGVTGGFNYGSLAMPDGLNSDGAFFSDTSMNFVPGDHELFTNNEQSSGMAELPSESACSSSAIIFNARGGANGGSLSEASMLDFWDLNKKQSECDESNHVSPVSGNFCYNSDNLLADDKGLVQALHHAQPMLSSKAMDLVGRSNSTNLTGDICSVNGGPEHTFVSNPNFLTNGKGAKDDALFASSRIYPHQDAIVGKYNSLSSSGDGRSNLTSLERGFQSTQTFASSKMMQSGYIKNERETKLINQMTTGIPKVIPDSLSSISGGLVNLTTLGKGFPGIHTMNKGYVKNENESIGLSQVSPLGYNIVERESKLMNQMSMGLSKMSNESIHSNSSDCRSSEDDDPDICILEDISQPACSNQSTLLVKNSTLQRTIHSDSHHNAGLGSSRPKAVDERFIFRVAMQDLNQPKSEACPPDGLMAVPLLRHQRIALSWMVQKETANQHCSGGILADDQGLGKTISTIALILKERPRSTEPSPDSAEKFEPETVNLDDDDDDAAAGFGEIKQESADCLPKLNGCSRESSLSMRQAKGRPSAGTLVVCPTSVLRQWADELQNKVTTKANLSVLVYHGSNRTKDPSELAKYDIVLTTYSIVSMEVPKKPSVDDDEEWGSDGDGFPVSAFKSGKKRTYKPTSDKKGKKRKKQGEVEPVPRPLAKVGWFRVILDEAQSIKNHRTQVARACWGLRAKRRWCLSGTPLQNAIDDLYSYFRFLRYYPLSSYTLFRNTIKVPITRNPSKGYMKLQTVLKTIMLRRTKGSLLDGKPIINLPPKVVELRKVDFSDEERDFYTKLEADSRAQFQEYAAAGTVKQNYVNILLMLLRLRQACDHPLLVKASQSNSLWKSSAETAKKLPREKQTALLTCLEISLQLCGICNDPPEDAVVSVCGHVFCSQCISEHLTGDDNHCPSANCKVQLSTSAVFTKAILNSSISGQPGENTSGSEAADSIEPDSDGPSYDSSKIKAALEVLKSLTKPQDNALNVNGCSEDLGHLHAGDSHNGVPDKQSVVMDKNSDDSKKPGEKALVFSQWTGMLDLFEDCLKSSSIQYRRLDGTMSVAARDKAVKDFKTIPEVSVMIMSLKAASLGLNLVSACHVLLLDLWWNPTTEDQAIDRAHRIGQTRQVTVLRLTVKDTVEDRILALQQKKREMVASAFGEDEKGTRQTRLTVEDLEYLFMA